MDQPPRPFPYLTFNALMVPGLELMQASGPLLATPFLNLAQALTAAALLMDLPNMEPIYTENGVTVKMPTVGYYRRMFFSYL